MKVEGTFCLPDDNGYPDERSLDETGTCGIVLRDGAWHLRTELYQAAYSELKLTPEVCKLLEMIVSGEFLNPTGGRKP